MGFDYHVIIRYLPELLHGLMMTCIVLAVSEVLSIALGGAICACSLARSPVLRSMSAGYVDVFRVMPELVLIFWIYFCFPIIFNVQLSGFWSGVIGLFLTSAAFHSEIFRAGIVSIPAGEVEAARALAIGWYPRWRFIILPQALRTMSPSLLNTLADLVKHTSLLTAVGVAEMTFQAYTLGERTFRHFEFLTVVGVAYFAIIFPVSLGARFLNQRVRNARARGAH